MQNPFKRRPAPDPRADARAAEDLRFRLAEQAAHAPSGETLAERIIARAEAEHGATSAHRPRIEPARAPWGRLVAVAAAVVVVAGAAVAVTQFDTTPDHQAADRSTTLAPPTTPTASRPPTSAPRSTGSDDPGTDSTGSRVIKVPTLTNVRVVDITFTGTQDGWGLASADCIRTSGRCSALLRTTDGAKVWQSRPNTPFQVPGVDGCSAPCVTHIRFANDDTGYAYGPSAMFLTTDGAKTWRRTNGGAVALETLDDNVIRVTTAGDRTVTQTAGIGSTDWTTVPLPGTPAPGPATPTLTRTGSHAYLLAAGRPGSVLWTSADDGASWTNRAEPCARGNTVVDARGLTTAADGSVVVLCRERTSGKQFVTVSTDGGARFKAYPSVLGTARVGALGAASNGTILVSSDDTYRSGNSGLTFTRLGAAAGQAPGAAVYLGFSSDLEAHAISADGRSIFTTKDAGRTWGVGRFA